jgi:hypothetical protein
LAWLWNHDTPTSTLDCGHAKLYIRGVLEL